ncbi:MAG: hypothetical protein LBL34_02230 [Clostridiales bacterium]|jgi:hypothetical protein|nr:hypothetical protein [Clostridiales bacterium]
MIIPDFYCFLSYTGSKDDYFDFSKYDKNTAFNMFCMQEDLLLAESLGKLVLFDLRKGKFINSKGKKVDIAGKTIFCRTSVGDTEEMFEAIEKHGGKIIGSLDETLKVRRWFDYIQPQHRRIAKTNHIDVLENMEKHMQEFDNPFFLKSLVKNFAGKTTCSIENMQGSGPNMVIPIKKYQVEGFPGVSFRHGNNNEDWLISNFVNVNSEVREEQDFPVRREWRVFVVSGEILSISRFSDYIIPIESDITIKIEEEIARFGQVESFPKNYVCDFFEYDKNGETFFDICEFNPIESAGVYRSNGLIVDDNGKLINPIRKYDIDEFKKIKLPNEIELLENVISKKSHRNNFFSIFTRSNQNKKT